MSCNTCQAGQWVPMQDFCPWEGPRQSHLGTMLSQSLPVNSSV